MMIKETTISAEAHNLASGPFGTCFNGQTFQQEAIVSHNGWQYAAFYSKGGVLSLARRELPDGGWQVALFEDYAVKHDDVHNVPVVGVCLKDGTIHLSYDHHGSRLHYRRSVPGLASEPAKFAWEGAAFSADSDELVAGEPMKSVTYPGFIAMPDGRLQLLYRLGASGDGDWHLAEYDGSAGWTQLGMLLSRKGSYDTSPSRCAYPNPLRYDADGRLSITWCWRERPACGITDLRTNHDLCFAHSDDFGRTWQSADGATICRLGDGGVRGNGGDSGAITVDTKGIVVRGTKFLWGQMNTTTQFTDSKGRAHVINWQMFQDSESGSKDMNPWRYYHYWRGADSAWRTNLLPFAGRKPQIIFDAAGAAYVIHARAENRNYHGSDPGGLLTIARAAEASGWTDWEVVWQDAVLSVGEPLYDAFRLAKENILTIYTQEKPAAPGAPSRLRAIDFELPGMPFR